MAEPEPQMVIYTPANWHWLVADTKKVFSSAARAYVNALPKGAPFTRIANEAELWDVLRAAAPQCLPDGVEKDAVPAPEQIDQAVNIIAKKLGVDPEALAALVKG